MSGSQVGAATIPEHGQSGPARQALLRPEHPQRGDNRQGLPDQERGGQTPRGSASALPPPVVLSFGGGKNSTAVLVRYLREGWSLDAVVFADTGEESPETMAVVDHAKALCKRHGVRFAVVKSHLGRLVDYYRDNKIVPYATVKSCTVKFKIRPVRKWMTENGFRPVTVLVGIAYDEIHRVRDSDVKWANNDFPLVDWKWGRQECRDEIEKHWDGPPVPKSGCMGCPLQGRANFLKLSRDHPKVFQRWREMEENGRHYGDPSKAHALIPGGPVLAALGEQSFLDLGAQDERDAFCGGGCFT